MENNLQDDLITMEEFESLLQIGRSTAYRLLRSGELKAFKIGRIWKIPRAAVKDYIQRKSSLRIS
ncbi:MAG: helix-turn-helix domain-containing protein [Lachnospiraceae bacterium]|nr:helix-turn-helix domain-containing protein [Lachnospiraceae bacterium]